MIAEVSVHSLDSVHQSESVAIVTNLLEQSGLEYEVGPMGTTLSGNADDIFDALKSCSQSLLNSHPGYHMAIQVEDRKEDKRNLSQQEQN